MSAIPVSAWRSIGCASSLAVPNIPQSWPPPRGHVNAPGAEGNDTLVVEEELADGTFGRRVDLEGRVALEVATVEGDHAALVRSET